MPTQHPVCFDRGYRKSLNLSAGTTQQEERFFAPPVRFNFGLTDKSESWLNGRDEKLLGALAIGLAIAIWASVGQAAQLLSIIGLDVTDTEYVEAFDITTRGIQVRAVCHIPPGWSITAGRTAGYEGQLAGSASVGAAGLDRNRLGELQGLFLISQTLATGDAEMEGSVSLRTYGSGEQRDISFQPTHFRWVEVERCP